MRVGQFAIAASGGGAREETLNDPTTTPAVRAMTSWSRDGRFIPADRAPLDISVIAVGGAGKLFPFIEGTPFY